MFWLLFKGCMIFIRASSLFLFCKHGEFFRSRQHFWVLCVKSDYYKIEKFINIHHIWTKTNTVSSVGVSSLTHQIIYSQNTLFVWTQILPEFLTCPNQKFLSLNTSNPKGEQGSTGGNLKALNLKVHTKVIIEFSM